MQKKHPNNQELSFQNDHNTKKPTKHAPLSWGYVTQAHGLKGEVRLHLHNPNSEAFSSIHTLHLQLPGQTKIKPYKIVAKRPQPKGWLVQFEGIEDRTHAESLKRSEIFIEQDDLPDLSESEFYLFELIGLDAVSPDGEIFGSIKQVLPGTAYPMLVVQHQSREVFIPLVEQLTSIELEKQRVVIEPFLFSEEHL